MKQRLCLTIELLLSGYHTLVTGVSSFMHAHES